jgi:hypothetical protein
MSKTVVVLKKWLGTKAKVKHKATLFPDHCPAHPLVKLQNTELILLPANTTIAEPFSYEV